ncbi:death-on-curing protein [Pseudomonas sp. SG-MS2]|uniref:type II toxin-antitoxin system death-on-curing family toxin n=1 Tax=Pseudomonas sp. SG-MS2 TaxID=1914534 RepID=UPI00137AFD13|nr:Fic family protein [Pseudomonas sp. SG-MS2]KAF1311199.1 death-on-curing protein [Pseudomonas sp. SG-MS2]
MFLYFDVNHAIEVHDWIISNSGGRPGIFNIGNLESPLEHVKNDDYYPSIEEKLTFLVYSINKNHAFNDGNKRSSIALGAYLLKLNGYGYVVPDFISKMENIAVWVADNVVNRDLLHELLTSMIYEEDFSEELKLKLVSAIPL